MSRIVTLADLANFCLQWHDQSAQAMLLDDQGRYRPVVELVPMHEGRVVIAGPGDYDRIVQSQEERRQQGQPVQEQPTQEQPKLRLAGEGQSPEDLPTSDAVFQVLDSYDAKLMNENPPRVEEVWEIACPETATTIAYATSLASADIIVDVLTATRAVQARIRGEWDHPALTKIGPLHPDTQADCLRIVEPVLDRLRAVTS